MTPDQRAAELIQQSRPTTAELQALSPAAPGGFLTADMGAASTAAEIARLRLGAVTDAGNILQNVRMDIPADPSASRVGGTVLLDQFRAAGVPVKTFEEHE